MDIVNCSGRGAIAIEIVRTDRDLRGGFSVCLEYEQTRARKHAGKQAIIKFRVSSLAYHYRDMRDVGEEGDRDET